MSIKVKNEKGYTGIDIAISIVVLFIFVSMIAFLIYNFNSSAREIELKSDAVNLAVEEAENMKNLKFEQIQNYSIVNGNSNYILSEEVKTGFYKTVKIEDYADLEEDKISGIVKKITVEIKYKFKNQEQMVGLSTIIAKEI